MTREDLALAIRLADCYSLVEIEYGGTLTVVDGARNHRWYDVRPMLDGRRHAPEFIDLNAEILRWAELRGMLVRHSTMSHLVRLQEAAA